LQLNFTAGFPFPGASAALAVLVSTAAVAKSQPDPAVPSIFSPASTPADSIYHLSLFVLAVTGLIFVVVFWLLAYVTIKFRRRPGDDNREPPQIYGSNQVELAWTVIPVLIVVVLFLAAARVIHAVEDARFPPGTIEITAIGNQFWWEFQYPAQGFTTANELHVPVSDRGHPTPTHITLMSADTDHSFWVPKLAGKTDLIPNRVNRSSAIWYRRFWAETADSSSVGSRWATWASFQKAKRDSPDFRTRSHRSRMETPTAFLAGCAGSREITSRSSL
jgi:heme/copper-type cytochrome/quinol oxidase subunit 2